MYTYTVNGNDLASTKPVFEEVLKVLQSDESKKYKPKKAEIVKPQKEERLAIISRFQGSGSRPNSKQTKEVRKKVKFSVKSGFCSLQGQRKTMEDKHVIFDDMGPIVPGLDGETKYRYYAVYDGHGGDESAILTEQILHQNIFSTYQQNNYDIDSAIGQGMKASDEQICKTVSRSGTTVVLAILRDEELIIANLGDSEAIVASKAEEIKGTVVSFKHNPTIDSEKERIQGLGGMIVFGRLFGSLAVSRSLGDKEFKEDAPFVSNEPFIDHRILTKADKCLILACDGLWDKINYQDAAEITLSALSSGKDATTIATMLANEALNRASRDNVTVIVIILNWK